ncbi:MAG: hypothetical protein QNJ54_18695 [Prochloraceae cyanobacterium]|nr:hypothetical protein [Prochloraceae cyanobacterium]
MTNRTIACKICRVTKERSGRSQKVFLGFFALRFEKRQKNQEWRDRGVARCWKLLVFV